VHSGSWVAKEGFGKKGGGDVWMWQSSEGETIKISKKGTDEEFPEGFSLIGGEKRLIGRVRDMENSSGRAELGLQQRL